MTNKTITVQDLATSLDTDPRTARKFLRSITPVEAHPGKGSRWVIEANAANMKALRKQYAAFDEARKVATPEVEVEVEVESTDAE